MNDSQWKRYQRLAFDLMIQYMKDTALPFEVLVKLNSSTLVFIDHIILHLAIQKAVKPYVDTWPTDFNSKMIYCKNGVVLQKLSSEDSEEFNRIFKHLSPIERFKLLCLWITREHARLVISKRLMDLGVNRAVLRKLDEQTFDTRYLYSTGEKVLRVKQKKGIPNALTRVLMDLTGRIKFLNPKDYTDAVNILSPFIQALNSDIQEQQTIKNFSGFLKHLWQSRPLPVSSENRNRWLRESWLLMGLSLLQTSFLLLPILESSKSGVKKVLDNFIEKDKQNHFERNIIIVPAQDIVKKFQPEKEFVPGAYRANRIDPDRIIHTEGSVRYCGGSK